MAKKADSEAAERTAEQAVLRAPVQDGPAQAEPVNEVDRVISNHDSQIKAIASSLRELRALVTSITQGLVSSQTLANERAAIRDRIAKQRKRGANLFYIKDRALARIEFWTDAKTTEEAKSDYNRRVGRTWTGSGSDPLEAEAA